MADRRLCLVLYGMALDCSQQSDLTKHCLFFKRVMLTVHIRVEAPKHAMALYKLASYFFQRDVLGHFASFGLNPLKICAILWRPCTSSYQKRIGLINSVYCVYELLVSTVLDIVRNTIQLLTTCIVSSSSAVGSVLNTPCDTTPFPSII